MEPSAWVCKCFFLVLLITGTSGKAPDVQVTCLFSEDCVLPCSFKPVGGEAVQWFKQDVLIYSHPQSNIQPNEQFVGRTSMSTKQFRLGNASLLLQHSGPQDRGRYKCRVIKGKEKNESFVIMKMEARIHSVNLEVTRLSGFEEVKCSTQDVYPAPHVSWSTEPATLSEKIKPVTRKMANKQGLYNVESKVKRQKDYSEFTYICTINSTYSTQSWRTSLTETVVNNSILTSKSSLAWREVRSAEGKDLIIPCKAPWVMQSFTLTWTFTLARTLNPTVICTYDSKAQLLSNQWKNRTLIDAPTVQAGDGSLRLLGPQSLEHTGLYSCIISGLQMRYESQTMVNITSPDHEDERMERKESSTPWWVPAVVIALLAVIAAFIVGVLKLKDDCLHSSNAGQPRDSHQLKVTVTDGEVISEGSPLAAEAHMKQKLEDTL